MTASSQSPAQVRPGYPTEVAGRYRVLGKIAEGGMGVVYRAEHVLSKKRLALKLLYPHLCHGPQAVERFRREVSAAAEIDHPGIVQVFDAGVDSDGSFYMAMELLEGESLAAAIRREWPTTHRAVDYVRQVLGPLSRAHERGFVHRDIKPENIFLAKDPATDVVSLKLLDFGLTREVQRKGPTLTGITFGTPEYMSPEQCMSAKKAGTPSDVWSIGVLLYELLTGYHPFAGETPNAIMVGAIKDPFIPVATRAPHIPPALARIVERCLEKEPDKRPQTAAEVASLLEKAIGDVTLADTRPSRTHLDDAPADDAPLEQSLDGIPIGGAESTARLREPERPEGERGVSTAPTRAAIDVPDQTSAKARRMVWLLAAAVLALVGVGGALAFHRLTASHPRAADPARPTSAEPEASAAPEVIPESTPNDLVAHVAETAPPVAPEAGEPVEPAVEASPEAPPSGEARAPTPARTAPTPSGDPETPESPAPVVERTDDPHHHPASVAGERPRESGAELTPEQYSEAQACILRGDRACAIGILRGSRRPRDLARVIDLYEADGRGREATTAMQSFVRRFPSAPESERFRAELTRRGL